MNDLCAVLLVEDDPINQQVVAAILSSRGYEPTLADDGPEALSWLQRRSFHVILMDIRMPGMDGLEVARRIRALPDQKAAATPILALTADVFAENVRECMAAGMNGVIEKPLDPDKLLLALQHIEDQHPLILNHEKEEPLLDRDYCLKLVASLGVARVERLEALLKQLGTETLARYSALEGWRAGDPSPDWEGWGRLAHRLAGAAANLGLPRLCQWLRAMEEAAKEKNLLKLQDMHAGLPALYAQSMRELDLIIKDPPPPPR